MPDNNDATTGSATLPKVAPANNSTAAGTPTSVNVAAEQDDVQLDIANPPEESYESETQNQAEVFQKIISKINEAHNILVALSSDPSVDEMTAAIGLSLCLDRLGKRATAIYSGSTPNALEFLKPDETFESSTDALQDFVIALDKEKADHLRYKLDGNYVKIYITPYRSRLSEEDLDFSYGDFNVDLVIALDVANGIDLDAALREHGRIMHDAVIINVTTGNPGKFGEIEWSNKNASSVSEMAAGLLYSLSGERGLAKEEATALLTGIVAATSRFSNARTTAETMKMASALMESGANQQLISKNITPDMDNEIYSLLGQTNTTVAKEPITNDAEKVATVATDPTKLNIRHGDSANTTEEKATTEKETETSKSEAASLLDDLKAAEVSLAQAGAEVTPDLSNAPVRIEGDRIIEPTIDNSPTTTTIPAPKVLESNTTIAQSETPMVSVDNSTTNESSITTADTSMEPKPVGTDNNPAVISAPAVATAPEINGVPEINYMPMPDDEVLPPPPAPPIDTSNLDLVGNGPINVEPSGNSGAALESTESLAPAIPSPMGTSNMTPIQPAAPVASEETAAPLGPQPAMTDQVYNPQAADPGAFKIPGM